MLKGTAVIELTDVNTGKKEVVKHDNLVTNAINDLLTLNPLGMRFRSYRNGFNNTHDSSQVNQYSELDTSFASDFVPVCPNAIGGILLYEDTLEEDPAKYYAPMDNPLIGYASNDVNETDDIRRGSLNLNESGPLEEGSGYRFVFDFATTQANGTIASLGLTSARGGKAGYGAAQDKVGYSMLVVDGGRSKIASGSSSNDLVAGDYYTRNSFVAADPQNNLFYYARAKTANTIEVGKMRGNINTLSLTEDLFDFRFVESRIITTTKFASVTSSSLSSFLSGMNKAFAGTFVDGGDGYIWGFQHDGNVAGNSSGSASILWIKISKEDFSFEEGEWTLNATLYPFGISGYNDEGLKHLSYKFTRNHAAILNGRLYIPKYDRRGIYSVSLSNPTDTTLLECDVEVFMGRANADLPTNYYRHFETSVIILGDVVAYKNVYVNNGKVFEAGYGTAVYSEPFIQNSNYQYSKNKGMSGTLMTRPHCGPFFMCVEPYIYYSGGTYIQYMSALIYLMTPYLATINNLDTPVQKTADKTMKITYILREE